MPRPRRCSYWKALGAAVALLVVYALSGLPVAEAACRPWQAGLRALNAGPAPALRNQSQEFIQRVVDLTNQERARQGLAPLTLDAALCSSAQAHSEDMATHNFFDHTGSDGSDVGQRIARAGYGALYAYGENIAAGQTSPEEVVDAWMNSESHRSNIVSPYYHDIGVADVYNANSTYGHYWTQDLASHGPNPPPPPPTALPPTAVPPTPVPPTAVPPTRIPPTPTRVPATRAPATRAPTPAVPPPTQARPTPTPMPLNHAPARPTGAPPAVAPEPWPWSITIRFIVQTVELTNRERAKQGLGPLRLDLSLCNAAQAHSEDMAAHDFFSHTGSDGSTAEQRIAAAHRPGGPQAENIAGGQPSPAEVVNAWMNSEPQRRNILNPAFQRIGVGYAYRQGAQYQHYWTQDLASQEARPAASAPTRLRVPEPILRFLRLLPIIRDWTVG